MVSLTSECTFYIFQVSNLPSTTSTVPLRRPSNPGGTPSSSAAPPPPTGPKVPPRPEGIKYLAGKPLEDCATITVDANHVVWETDNDLCSFFRPLLNPQAEAASSTAVAAAAAAAVTASSSAAATKTPSRADSCCSVTWSASTPLSTAALISR